MVKIEFDEKNRRAIALDEEVIIGECDFLLSDECWNIVHTEVNNKYQGQGIARKLVECVIRKAKEANINVIAECSYARKILEKEDVL